MHEDLKNFIQELKRAILDGTSINDESKTLWTVENFANLHKALNDNLKEQDDSFLNKISQQITEAKDYVDNLTDEQHEQFLPLIFELLSLYYVYPNNIGQQTKVNRLEKLLNGDNSIAKKLQLSVDDFPISKNAITAGGIGSGGMGYNTNKQKEFFYLVDVFKAYYERESDTRPMLHFPTEDNIGFQNFLDEVADQRNPQIRNILLYLFWPDLYEFISSSSQKKTIIKVFSKFCDNDEFKLQSFKTEPVNNYDQKIRFISQKLEKLRGKPTNFYDDDLQQFWNTANSSLFEDLPIELIDYKKQLVLYGPPGTSKTHTAKELAKDIIRHYMIQSIGVEVLEESGKEQLKKLLKNNIHRLQLHPAYSYEDFIQGLQFDGGKTSFKPGYLLKLIDKMPEKSDEPHVLILDEINRVDLSRLFGECFSAIENRDEPIDLIGSNDNKNLQLTIPNNLYIIGTMNLIDHSVEQLDFALRRRFLWLEAKFNPEVLLEICESKWRDKIKQGNLKVDWETVASDFEDLKEAASNLNQTIKKEAELGSNFELGHVFFAEAVEFLGQQLEDKPNSRTYLFNDKGEPQEPLKKLWRLSLYPLLKEYLAGLDSQTQEVKLKELEQAFKGS